MLEQDIIKWRRDLHQIPELGLKEFKTAAYIRNELKKMGYEYEEVLQTGTLVYLDFKAKETIAFRSDIDGLKITEKNEIDFKSTHDGYMHACGHDGHMTMLLGFAKYLSESKKTYPYNILLIFQPAEESPGAAKLLIEQNIKEKYHIKAIFGMHLMPDLPYGKLACRPGPLMAECGELHVKINGKSAHAGLYHQGIDTIMIASQMIQLYKSIIVTKISPLNQCLLHIGLIQGGSSNNIVASSTEFHGTVRTYSEEDFFVIQGQMKKINQMMEETYGCTIEFSCDPMYPPVLNDYSIYDYFKKWATKPGDIELKEPYMLAEDFAFYQTKIPGVFFFLGTNDGTYSSGLHTETFNFDEKVLLRGIQAYKDLIEPIEKLI